MLGLARKFACCCDLGVLGRSGMVALVVGPVILAINHGIGFLFDPQADYPRMAATLLVPFMVSCYSTTRARMRGLVDPGMGARDAPSARARWGAIESDVQQIEANARQVNETSKARFHDTQRLLEKARSTVDELENGAGLIEQALASIGHVATQFDAVGRLDLQTRQGIQNSSVRSAAVIESIEHSRAKFVQISTLANDIGKIGRQTTILSINAAVVAATAGEEGRRFAVIAESIRELAKQTEQQAKTIDATMQDLQQTAARMHDSSTELGACIETLQQSSRQSSQAVQGASTSLGESTRTTHECIGLLGTQLQRIREITAGISTVVDHAQGAIQGSARNATLANSVAERIGEAAGLHDTQRAGIAPAMA